MPVKPHCGPGEPADVENVDHHQIARLGTLDAERPAQIVHLGQVDVTDVVGAVVVPI